MIQTSSPSHFFFSILLAAIVLTVLIFLPFLAPLVFAIALAVVFAPIHRRILRMFFRANEKSSLGALVTIILIAATLFVPLFFLSMKAYSELRGVYTYLLDEGGRAQAVEVMNSITDSFFGAFPGMAGYYSPESFNVVSLVDGAAIWVFTHFNDIFLGVTKTAVSFFIMCLALFYLLRDGGELKRQLIALSPLENVDDEHIFSKLQSAVRSIFAGSIAVGIIQGILTGIGLAIFQVPNPVLWGAVASIAALIPGIGTSLVLLPSIFFLYATGSTPAAIGLAVWSFVAVGLIDNFLGPIFMNRGIKIHPFLILLSVLGGLIFFGPIGFVMGPLALAFLFSLLEIYRSSRNKSVPET